LERLTVNSKAPSQSKFNDTCNKKTDWQELAAFTAVNKKFCIITGGPGTGKTATIKKIVESILDWNPWITGDFPESLVGFKREVDIVKYLDFKEIKIIEGPRRSGKSTLLYRVIQALLKEKKKVLYLNFDDEALRGMTLEEVFDIFAEYKDIDYLFVDEIQNCQNWVSFVRKAYDTKSLKQIWITGSNSNLIKEEYATYLTGRNVKLKISPLNFREFLSFNNKKYDSKLLSSKQKTEIKRFFKEYLEYGGFPEVVLRNTNKKELLINYYEDFLYKDIVSRYGADAEKLRNLSTYLNTNTSKLVSYRNLSKVLQINYNTTTKYISYFLEVYLFSLLYRFDHSLKKQIRDDKKIYALDTGLANAVSFKFSEDYGRQLENVVFSQLKNDGYEVYYHSDGVECDFVVRDKGRVVKLVQVSASLQDEKTKEREINGLLSAMDRYDMKEGLILTDDEEGEEIHNNKTIQIMSVWRWLLGNSMLK